MKYMFCGYCGKITDKNGKQVCERCGKTMIPCETLYDKEFYVELARKQSGNGEEAIDAAFQMVTLEISEVIKKNNSRTQKPTMQESTESNGSQKEETDKSSPLLDYAKQYGLGGGADETEIRSNPDMYGAKKYIPRCPTCQSTYILPIPWTRRVLFAILLGLFSKTAKSQFKCYDCGYMW